MRLMRFSFTISHVAGKDLVTTNTLYRAPVSTFGTQDEERYCEVEAYPHVSVCLPELSASNECIEQVKARMKSVSN